MKETLEWLQSVGIDRFVNDKYQNLEKKPTPKVLNTKIDDSISSQESSLESISEINHLKEYIENLTHPLKENSTNTVFGDGNQKSSIMFIGEAPGHDEDISGKPFVGQSGQLLTNIMLSIGIKREDIYITNVIPWRPLNNRTPSKEEIDYFRPILYKHIEIISPKLIISLGAVATKAVANTNEGILTLRGKWQKITIKSKEYEIFPTYHPSYLLRSSSQKKTVWRDFIELKIRMNELGINIK